MYGSQLSMYNFSEYIYIYIYYIYWYRRSYSDIHSIAQQLSMYERNFKYTPYDMIKGPKQITNPITTYQICLLLNACSIENILLAQCMKNTSQPKRIL